MQHTGNDSLRLNMVGISATSMLDFRRGGVSGGGFGKGLAVGISSSPSSFSGGVWVSELDDESVNILSFSFSGSISTVWLRLLAWKVKEVASGLSSLVSER